MTTQNSDKQPLLNEPEVIRIAVIGDLHAAWDQYDVHYFNNSNYDLLFFTGDLGSGSPGNSLNIAKSLSELVKPTLIMPGNNDVSDAAQIAAEFAHQKGMESLFGIEQRHRSNSKSPDVRFCGYSHESLSCANTKIALIAARPYSLGGPDISFSEELDVEFGVKTLAESKALLEQLIVNAEADHIIFLAHNGPFGLGANENDMWGCDFKSDGGDWGDTDLQHAISFALSIGKKVLAVIGGHMHLKTKSGSYRPWLIVDKATHVRYINASLVPRIFSKTGTVKRHHVSLELRGANLQVSQVFVET